MATVDKNFRIKNGLVVEGTVATVNGNQILTEDASDSYIINLIGGTATSDNTANTVVKRDANGNFAAGTVTVGALTLNGVDLNTRLNGIDSDAQSYANSAETAANSYTDTAISAEVTNRNNAIATAKSEAIASANSYTDGEITTAISTAATDATNKSNQALSDAQNYANSLASNYDAAGSAASAEQAAKNYADGLAGNYDAAGAASTAESNANTYTDNAISGLSGNGTAVVAGNLDILTGTGIQVNGSNNSVEIDRQTVDTWYDAAGAATTAYNNAVSYTDQEIAALVDSAPALLDTLNELAAAIADNPNYASDVANLVATKADTTYVDGEISSLDTAAQGYASTAQSNAQSFATTAANNAQSAAENYADSLASNYDAAGSAATAQSNAETFATNAANTAQSNAEGYADNLTNNILDGSTSFSDININDVAKQVASRATALGSVTVTAYQFNKSAFKSGKFLVKIDNGTHNEISEILVTLDSSNNVAITEYAIVGTNGSRGTITADVDATHCRIRVTPVNDSTITVAGTVFNS